MVPVQKQGGTRLYRIQPRKERKGQEEEEAVEEYRVYKEESSTEYRRTSLVEEACPDQTVSIGTYGAPTRRLTGRLQLEIPGSLPHRTPCRLDKTKQSNHSTSVLGTSRRRRRTGRRVEARAMGTLRDNCVPYWCFWEELLFGCLISVSMGVAMGSLGTLGVYGSCNACNRLHFCNCNSSISQTRVAVM